MLQPPPIPKIALFGAFFFAGQMRSNDARVWATVSRRTPEPNEAQFCLEPAVVLAVGSDDQPRPPPVLTVSRLGSPNPRTESQEYGLERNRIRSLGERPRAGTMMNVSIRVDLAEPK